MTSSGVDTRMRGTRRRGERTRQRILDATLVVLGREGVRGTTHRAVAAEAGVQLSLTTYYFRDLNELLAETFRRFMERDREALAAEWERAFAYLEQYTERDLEDPATRKRVTEYIVRKIVAHMADKLAHAPEGLAAEHHFFYEAQLDPALEALSREHRRRLLEPIVQLCRHFGSDDPKTDARLLFGTITRLEYESLRRTDEVDLRPIRREIRRIVGWLIGNAAGP